MVRRRIELIEPGMASAPIHHEGKSLDDAAAAALVAKVRASAIRASSAALDELAAALPEPIVSVSLRAWPFDFPEDISIQRRPPYESHADSIMYRQVLAELAHERRLLVGGSHGRRRSGSAAAGPGFANQGPASC